MGIDVNFCCTGMKYRSNNFSLVLCAPSLYESCFPDQRKKALIQLFHNRKVKRMRSQDFIPWAILLLYKKWYYFRLVPGHMMLIWQAAFSLIPLWLQISLRRRYQERLTLILRTCVKIGLRYISIIYTVYI